ncbi:MAG: prepilin-type N-terminal cleavage/methylation domain-containing protein [Pyrinomonadaceae bacterium]
MSNKFRARKRKNEQGFSMVEAIIAILILTIGLIGTAAAITYALKFGAISRNVTNAKLLAVGEIEEIDSLRDTRRLDFNQIANVGSVDNSKSKNTFTGFTTGFQPISLNPGPDGVDGTADDLRDPGADGAFGTADDFDNPALVRSGYQRQITITNLTDSLKKVEVKIRYFSSGGNVGELTAVSYINDEVRVTQ